MITYATACGRALRFLRLMHHRADVRIETAKEYETHWLLTYALPSTDDPSRIQLYADIVAEKQTGCLYTFPSRARVPIDKTEISSIRRGCSPIGMNDLEKLELEMAKIARQPTCRACGSTNLECDGGIIHLVAGQDEEVVEWNHSCHECGNEDKAFGTRYMDDSIACMACCCVFANCNTVLRDPR